jgi:hypothetical protein
VWTDTGIAKVKKQSSKKQNCSSKLVKNHFNNFGLTCQNVQFFLQKTANFEIQTAPVNKSFVPLCCQNQHIVTQSLVFCDKNYYASLNQLLAIKQPLKVVFVFLLEGQYVYHIYINHIYHWRPRFIFKFKETRAEAFALWLSKACMCAWEHVGVWGCMCGCVRACMLVGMLACRHAGMRERNCLVVGFIVFIIQWKYLFVLYNKLAYVLPARACDLDGICQCT